MFRVSTYDQAATVTISQPANTAFSSQTINLPANTSGKFEFPPQFAFVENDIPNQILNKGFLITSTTPITAYYEVIGGCMCNPEIFALKGQNAIGTRFYVPFQTFLDNSDAHTPTPYSAFDIVATQDGTKITILPTQDIVGHSANTSFTIQLNRGQTWSGRAASQLGNQHPSGTLVIADKPIAITIKDDLLVGGAQYGGFCRDLVGDQIVPVSNIGRKYVIQKGSLDGIEKIFVVGTEPGTNLWLNGSSQGIVSDGQTRSLDILSGSNFLLADKPVYVLQITGVGCETAGAVLPTVECTSGRSFRFVRPTTEDFWLFLVTQTGYQDFFTITSNGISHSVPGSDFTIVPGSGGNYVAAKIQLDETVVPTQKSILVENSAGWFQMGFLNGAPSATGARFGFFSDFIGAKEIDEHLEICLGDTLVWRNKPIFEAGTYEFTIPNKDLENCDTLVHTHVTVLPIKELDEFLNICMGDTVTWRGKALYKNGTYTFLAAAPNPNECDSLIHTYVNIVTLNEIHEYFTICEGDTIVVHGQAFYEKGTYDIALPSQHPEACDTLIHAHIFVEPYVKDEMTFNICAGESVIINGIPYSSSGFAVSDTIPSIFSCDTIRTYRINVFDPSVRFQPNEIEILLGLTETLHPIILATPPYQLFWSPQTGLDLSNPEAPIVSPTTTTGYEVLIVDSLGCKDSAWINVIVRDPMCSGKWYIPNVFSPNDDGVNDRFTVYTNAECVHKIAVLRIFDRWGSLVFEAKDFEPNNEYKGWDGYIGHKEAASAVYTYYCEFAQYDQKMVKLKGSVTLLR
ncbi:MAG: gliding motility-associated C-terminal domain-containing protein [Bacteroidota bacterium]